MIPPLSDFGVRRLPWLRAPAGGRSDSAAATATGAGDDLGRPSGNRARVRPPAPLHFVDRRFGSADGPAHVVGPVPLPYDN